MPKARRCYTICLFLVATAFLFISVARSESYKGFLKLNPDECVPLDKKVVDQLPADWHKYGDFVKICGLPQKKGQPAKVSIISVWAHDYYATLPAGTLWENLPRPLIVDSSYREIGLLREVYPADPPRDLYVHYGRWEAGLPTEIRVDVHNPAVDGDYFYAPLKWNKKSGRYEMKSKEVTYGIRRR